MIAEEEVSRRKGHSTPLKDDTPARTATTSPTGATPPPRSLSPSPTIETTAATSAAVVEPPRPMSPLSFPTQTVVPDTTATATSPAVVTPTPLVSPSPPSLPLQELPPSPTPQRTPSHSQTAPGPDGANERPVPPTPSRSLSPGPGTAEPTDDLDQTASEQGRLPSPEGAFTFDGSSGFITVDAIKYLQTVRAGRRWTDMVTSYLRLEELPISPAVRTFHSLSFAQTDDIIRPLFAYPLNLGQMRY